MGRWPHLRGLHLESWDRPQPGAIFEGRPGNRLPACHGEILTAEKPIQCLNTSLNINSAAARNGPEARLAPRFSSGTADSPSTPSHSGTPRGFESFDCGDSVYDASLRSTRREPRPLHRPLRSNPPGRWLRSVSRGSGAITPPAMPAAPLTTHRSARQTTRIDAGRSTSGTKYPRQVRFTQSIGLSASDRHEHHSLAPCSSNMFCHGFASDVPASEKWGRHAILARPTLVGACQAPGGGNSPTYLIVEIDTWT